MSHIVLSLLTNFVGYCIIIGKTARRSPMDEELQQEENVQEEKDEKSISADLIRGHINTIILRALYDGDKYGYEILEEIEQKSHGQYSLKQPTLYSALKRLEKDGYITSYWGGSVGGGRRKYFSLTDEGKTVAEQNQSEWEYSRTIIDSLISDKDFDFSNPAPSAVNMRVLQKSTSRVHSSGDDEEGFAVSFEENHELDRLSEALAARTAELEESRTELERERARFEAELAAQRAEQAKLYVEREEELRTLLEAQVSSSQISNAEARAREEELLRQHEEQTKQYAVREAALASDYEEKQRELAAREAALSEERTQMEALLTERLEAERSQMEALLRDRLEAERLERTNYAEQIRKLDEQIERTRVAYEEELHRRSTEIEEARARNVDLSREYLKKLEAAHEDRRKALEDQERRLREEHEIEFRQREKQLIHQNFINLVNSTPPPQKPEQDYGYYSRPVQPAAPIEDEPEYRTVVQGIYEGAIRSDEEEPVIVESRPRAQSLGGIDFLDLEERAARDGIRIATAGKKEAFHEEKRPEELVHKGKALFLSAIVVFFVCLAEGSIVLAIQNRLSLPLILPYFIWGAGLILLLVTGLLYANHYGEKSLRRTGRVLVNAIVTYVLVLIVILIVALAIPIDFASISALATFIFIPAIFFFGIIIFGATYYSQVRTWKKK